jgi:hypothetical protein
MDDRPRHKREEKTKKERRKKAAGIGLVAPKRKKQRR